jgi:hypothetical protein
VIILKKLETALYEVRCEFPVSHSGTVENSDLLGFHGASLYSYSNPEDGDTAFFRNVGKH